MLSLAQTRRTEAAEKLLKSFGAAYAQNCVEPGSRDTQDWLQRSRKALLDILTGEAKLTVSAPKVDDYKPETEAA